MSSNAVIELFIVTRSWAIFRKTCRAQHCPEAEIFGYNERTA